MARSAHDLNASDVVLGHFTLGRTYPILDRLAAAREAGVAGIGLFMADLEVQSSRGFTDDELQRQLTDHGLLLVDLDLINLCPSDPQIRARSDRFLRRAIELADRFGFRYLQTIAPDAGADAAGFEQTVDALGVVADAMAPFDVEVGLEYTGFTTVTDLDEALAVVEACGRPNLGVCIDVWHHRRAPKSCDLAAVPAQTVKCVQLNDGPLIPEHPDYKFDCVNNRWVPGVGEMDVAGLITELRSVGVDVPWTVEVCRGDEQLVGDAGRRHVLASVAATRQVLGLG